MRDDAVRPKINSRNMGVEFADAKAGQDTDITDAMAALYDQYFFSNAYEERYPLPNYATLERIMALGAGRASNILDFGCGNGRYGLALLARSQARFTGYDISQASLTQFASTLQSTAQRDRVSLVHGMSDLLNGREPYDLVLMLFGVLSHIGLRQARLQALCKIRSMMTPNGQLFLTVPSIYRRRPFDLLKSAMRRRFGKTQALLSEPGNIFYARRIGGKPVEFFYHLYSVRNLREELAQCGFKVRQCMPESVLPEWLIAQSARARRVDRLLLPFLPASLGYGICVVADPV